MNRFLFSVYKYFFLIVILDIYYKVLREMDVFICLWIDVNFNISIKFIVVLYNEYFCFVYFYLIYGFFDLLYGIEVV